MLICIDMYEIIIRKCNWDIKNKIKATAHLRQEKSIFLSVIHTLQCPLLATCNSCRRYFSFGSMRIINIKICARLLTSRWHSQEMLNYK